MSETASGEWWLPPERRDRWPDPDGLSADILGAVSEPCYIYDRRGVLLDWNDAFRELVGHDDERLAAIDPIGFVAEESRPEAERTLARVGEGEEVTTELRLSPGGGPESDYELTATPLADDDGDVWGLVGTVRDVGPRKDRQQELRRYEQLVETLGDGMYVVDEDRRFMLVNDALLGMLGYERSELLGTRATEVLGAAGAPSSGEHRDRRHDRAVRTVEGEAVTAGGERLPVRGRVSPLPAEDDGAIIGVIRDLTDRRERGRQLQETTERLDLALEGAELATWDWNPQTGDLRFNERWATMLGYDPDTLEQHEDTWERLVHPDDVDDAWAELETLLAGEVETYETEFRMRTADGDWRWIRSVGQIFEYDEDGEAVRAAGTHQDVTERKRREQTLRRYRSLVNAMRDVACIYDAEGNFAVVNDYLARAFDTTREELIGQSSRLVPNIRAEADGDPFRELVEGERTEVSGQTEVTLPDGRTVISEYQLTRLTVDGEFNGVVCVSRNVTERKRRTDRLEAQRDELETLNRLNGLIQQTLGALALAASREEMEATVCENLGGSSLYRFAFIGARDPGSDVVVPRTDAGDGTDYLDAVTIPADSDADGSGPIARSFETGEVTVVNDVETDPSFEPLREPALEHGFRSVAAVPLAHGGVVHEVLAVYADRPGAFSDREVQAFEVLGELVGFAISAAQDRRLIETDTHVEVGLRVSDGDSFLRTLSERLETRCRLLGSAQTSDAASLHYVAVDADPAAVREAAADHEHCSSLRHVRTDEAAVFEARLDRSVTGLLRESGVNPVETTATEGELTVVAEAPRDVAVRRLTDRLEDAYDDVTLVSKQRGQEAREADPDPGPGAAATAPTRPTARLTDRQRAALTAAYFAGYFDWPRDSTAEEVAESLDIASPTLHQHLRHAQRKLFESLLDDRA